MIYATAGRKMTELHLQSTSSELEAVKKKLPGKRRKEKFTPLLLVSISDVYPFIFRCI